MNKKLTEHRTSEVQLFKEISGLIESARQHSLQLLNKTSVVLYWHIGHKINQNILDEKRAKYGANIIQDLALQLQTHYGRGFGRRVIERCIQFARFFPEEKIILALSSYLTWTHFVTLLSIDNQLKREFYAEMCRIERWGTRLLNEKIASMLFERTALAKKPETVIHSEIEKLRHTNELHPDCVIQDPYVFENLFPYPLKTEKSEERIELLQLENSGIRVCQYLTELPPREIFEARLHDAIKRARERYESQHLLAQEDEQ